MIKYISKNDWIRPPLVFFEKKYNDWIKCKLSKSRFKWTGHNFIQALGCVCACKVLFKSTLYFQRTFIGTPFVDRSTNLF